jgi:SprT protein
MNFKLLMRNSPEDAINTVIHEWCHVLAYYLKNGVCGGHGRLWKQLMIQYGANPKRCHNMNADDIGLKRKFTYECGCCEHKLTIIRHRRIQQGKIYLCATCGRPIRFKG